MQNQALEFSIYTSTSANNKQTNKQSLTLTSEATPSKQLRREASTVVMQNCSATATKEQASKAKQSKSKAN
jgi:hypothetical protein